MSKTHHLHRTHPEIVRRLKPADGHVKVIIEMIQAGRPCLGIRPIDEFKGITKYL